VGVATLIMLGGLIEGLIGQLNGLAGSGGTGNITIMQRDVADMSLSSLDERVVSQLRAMPQIKAVSPYILGVVTAADMPGGLDPNDPAMQHYQLRQGRYVQRPNEIILGKIAAETYKLNLGGTITLYDNRYRIVGIFETGIAYEDGGGILALREAQRLLGRGRTVSFIFVDVQNPTQARAVAATIDRRFPEARASLSSEFAQQTDDMQTSMAMMDAIRLLAMLVGGIVVANTMIMSIYERTREIGALRALGWSARRILGQILQESLYLCLIAALLGAGLGVLLLTGVAQLPFASSMIVPVWHIQTFAQAVAVALLLGLLGGLYPAWRASRLQPVEALRYE
jgi:putative ABC transport system permease protein